MSLDKALELFKIEDITQETSATLKGKYRKLMIKYHPDNCNGDENKAKDISIAYEILKDAAEKIRKYQLMDTKEEKYTLVIPLSKLIDAYSSKTVKIGQKEFNRHDIQKHNTLILSEVTIEHNGVVNRFSNVQHWSISDNYEINCDIIVEKLNNKEAVRIKLEDFDKEFMLSGQAVSIKIPLKFNISVDIRINKKLVNKDSEQ